MATINQYNSGSTIPLQFTFINAASGVWQNVIFPVSAGTSLSSTLSGAVQYSVFLTQNSGATGNAQIAYSTLNGIPIALTGLYANALSSSGDIAIASIIEGLTGTYPNPTSYTISCEYKLDNPLNNSSAISQQTQTFYVLSNPYQLGTIS